MQAIDVMALMNLKRGETALVLGNGPSMERIDFSRLKSTVVVLGMHRSWRQHNSPFHIILRQPVYWDEIADGCWTPRGIIITKTDQKLENWDLGNTRVAKVKSVSKRHPGRPGFLMPLHDGSGAIFCGQFAVEAAAYMGFRRICLTGYDMQNGSGHAFPLAGEHISWDSTRQVQRNTMGAVAARMREVYPDTQVLNLNPDSALRCFPFADLEELYVRSGEAQPADDLTDPIDLPAYLPHWDPIPPKIRIPRPPPKESGPVTQAKKLALTKSRARDLTYQPPPPPPPVLHPIALGYGSGSSRDPLRRPFVDAVISEG